MPVLFGLSMAIAILLCVHVVRTGRETFWLWIILAFQPLGGVVYLLTALIPDLMGGSTARNLQKAARQAIDPNGEYREAKLACDDTPTVRNQSRLAAAAARLGHHAEAEALYRAAAQGVHAEDPALLLGHANALIELGRAQEALTVLERLGQNEHDGRTAGAALALGRAYEALGRIGEADTALQWASQRLPGFEGIGRYAAFMARNGRRSEAQEAVDEMDKRLTKLKPQFRKEGRYWRDLAAKALAGA
jgi:hypothetical protein